MFRCHYEVLPADIGAFHLHVAMRPALRRATMRRYLLLLLVLPVAVMLIAWAAGGFRTLRLSPGALVTALLPSLLGLIVVPFFGMMRRSAARRGAALQVSGRAKDVLTGPIALTLSADGIEIATPGVRSLYAWRVIEGVEQSAMHLFILLGPYLAIVVPKRDLDTATIAGLDAAIGEHIARRDQGTAEAVEAPESNGRIPSP